jgi:hypothetical protein
MRRRTPQLMLDTLDRQPAKGFVTTRRPAPRGVVTSPIPAPGLDAEALAFYSTV